MTHRRIRTSLGHSVEYRNVKLMIREGLNLFSRNYLLWYSVSDFRHPPNRFQLEILKKFCNLIEIFQLEISQQFFSGKMIGPWLSPSLLMICEMIFYVMWLVVVTLCVVEAMGSEGAKAQAVEIGIPLSSASRIFLPRKKSEISNCLFDILFWEIPLESQENGQKICRKYSWESHTLFFRDAPDKELPRATW